jgi:hypothetical protein
MLGNGVIFRRRDWWRNHKHVHQSRHCTADAQKQDMPRGESVEPLSHAAQK